MKSGDLFLVLNDFAIHADEEPRIEGYGVLIRPALSTLASSGLGDVFIMSMNYGCLRRFSMAMGWHIKRIDEK